MHQSFQEHFEEMNIYFTCHFLNNIGILFTFDFLNDFIELKKPYTTKHFLIE